MRDTKGTRTLSKERVRRLAALSLPTLEREPAGKEVNQAEWNMESIIERVFFVSMALRSASKDVEQFLFLQIIGGSTGMFGAWDGCCELLYFWKQPLM